MQKETETEETIFFFVTFLSLVTFQLGGGLGHLGPPLATPMVKANLLGNFGGPPRFSIHFKDGSKICVNLTIEDLFLVSLP